MADFVLQNNTTAGGYTVDTEPIENSDHLITSGAVYNAVSGGSGGKRIEVTYYGEIEDTSGRFTRQHTYEFASDDDLELLRSDENVSIVMEHNTIKAYLYPYETHTGGGNGILFVGNIAYNMKYTYWNKSYTAQGKNVIYIAYTDPDDSLEYSVDPCDAIELSKHAVEAFLPKYKSAYALPDEGDIIVYDESDHKVRWKSPHQAIPGLFKMVTYNVDTAETVLGWINSGYDIYLWDGTNNRSIKSWRANLQTYTLYFEYVSYEGSSAILYQYVLSYVGGWSLNTYTISATLNA